MHLIIDDMSCHTEIDGVDHFVIPVVFVAIKIGCLATMSYVDE